MYIKIFSVTPPIAPVNKDKKWSYIMGGTTYNCKIIDHLHTLSINIIITILHLQYRRMTLTPYSLRAVEYSSRTCSSKKNKDTMDGKLQNSLQRTACEHVS